MYLTGAWDDIPGDAGIFCFKSYLIEWSEDCDENGETDFGQILAGQLDDVNGNLIPDCCEGADTPTEDCNANGELDACELEFAEADADSDRVLDECERRFGDIDLDGTVGAADLSLLLSVWNNLEAPYGDLDGDGQVGAADLSLLLVRWGQSPPWAAPTIISISPNVGPAIGGTAVTITGTGLNGATAVAIGNASATSVRTVNSTTVTAVTPPGSAGLRTVSVTTATGSASLADAFTYIAAPTITSVTPSNGPLTGGTTISITGTNLMGVTSVTIGGVAATSVKAINSTTVSAVTPPGPVGLQPVIVSTSSGQASLPTGFSYVTTWFTVIDQLPDPAVVFDPIIRGSISATGLPWRVRDNGTNIEMLLVPPGVFNMGCSASNQQGCAGSESPVHQVTLTKPFYIGRFEVTQGQWAARMGTNPSYFQPPNTTTADISRPVEQVSWSTVQSFLSATGMRLPTEAEWEYAYRAGTTTAFHGFTGYPEGTSDDTLLGNIAWFSSNNGAVGSPSYGTKSVGQKSANGFGLHDMSGNVWEWVGDRYSSTYYESSPSVDPTGPSTGSQRVLRGGAWSSAQSGSLRASNRNSFMAGSDRYGFRVAKNALDQLTVTEVAPNAGPINGGTPITIKGTNLSGASSVQIGGVAATSVAVVDSTTVTAVSPVGQPGPRVVSVTTPTGTANLANGFTYFAPPMISSVSPNSGSTAGGTSITITGTNLTGTNSVTIDGVAASAVTVVNATTVTAVTPPGTVGPKLVSLTASAGSASLPGGFNYVSPWYSVIEFAPDPSVVTNAAIRAAIVATGYPWRVRDSGTNIELLLVPPGTFAMGCVAPQFLCEPDESPSHSVTLTRAFYISRFEVTQAQWAAKMGTNPSYFQPPNTPTADTNRPVEQVSWNMISSPDGFLAGTGLRLPTEAEWEYAYRAGTTTAFHSMPGYPNGTNNVSLVGKIAWFGGNSGYQTWGVGQNAANAFGLHDMSGNVWEFVRDWFGPYPSQALTDPLGAGSGTERVMRGGSFGSDSGNVRATYRGRISPASSSYDVGFRVAREFIDLPSIERVTPGGGPTTGGTPITIRGVNLTGVTSITIGGLPATSVTVIDAKTVTAVTPAGSAGAHDVVVTTPIGSATSTDAFRYVTEPTWAMTIEALPDPTIVTNAAIRESIIATGRPWRIRHNGTNIEMLLLPPGGFGMGCSPSYAHGCYTDENPVHSVSFTQPFYVSRYEVTQSEWLAAMGSNPSTYQGVEYPDSLQRPAESVSWEDVQNFLEVTGLQIPTEAQWEYAYRAGVTTAFHSGSDFPDGTSDDTLVGSIAWYSENSNEETHQVGGKAANGFGLHDMAGNVWEWVSDWYSETYYAQSPVINPAGPIAGLKKIVRGGSFYNTTRAVRASTRVMVHPNEAYSNVGLRVLKVAAEAPSIASIVPSEGSSLGGTTVTLVGANLTGTTSVLVDGVAATAVTVLDDSIITFRTPMGTPGARTVSLMTAAGSTQAVGGFTYTEGGLWYTVIEQTPDPAIVTNVTLRNAIAATGLPWRIRDNATQIEMLLVPAGSFNMGCSASSGAGCDTDENPVHSVTITAAFYIGRYEVTQTQWTMVMGSNPSYFSGSSYPDAADRPVEQVSWDAVQTMLAATGLRLPTEAEWEFACRAGTTTAFHAAPAFPNGTNDSALVGEIAWYASNSGNQTHVVGGRAANSLGLHDMLGNVGEWVADWYLSTYYSASSSTNPVGPLSGADKVWRGGHAGVTATSVRSSNRNWTFASTFGNVLGFRVVRDAVAISPPLIASVSPAIGPTSGGTTITITGSKLTRTKSVEIGGRPATSVTVLSDTTVTARTPFGIVGSRPVTITTDGGVATLESGFTYTGMSAWYTLLEQQPDPSIVTDAVHRNAIIATGLPWRVRDNASQIEMLLVPAGSFNMGCSPSSASTCDSDEDPVHPVTIAQPFYVGKYEVTQTQWAARMGGNPSWHQGPAYPNAPSQPVELVTWNDVRYFLASTGLRLPSEAEWEFAYRAGTATAYHSMPGYPTGTDDEALLGNIAWYSANAGTPRPVGGKSPNGFGLHDMAGNVWEYVGDWYSSSVYWISPQIDPQGPVTGTTRTVRGGWAANTGSAHRSSNRLAQNPAAPASGLGCRVARDPFDPPSLLALAPHAGPPAGGTLVTISGANLGAATSVRIGGQPVASFTIVSPTTVTAVTPPGALGPADVTVATPYGSETLLAGFTYQGGPMIVAVTPAAGPTSGGTAITITGVNLLGTSSLTVGGVEATDLSVVNSTTVTATTAANSPGVKTLSVTTPSGTTSVTNGFTYFAAPSISSVSPNQGPTAGGTAITITGTNLTGATAVAIGGVAATSVSVVSATTVTAVTPAGTAGAKIVSLTTPGGTANLTNGFTYGLGPTISSVSPNVGPTAGGTAITITGTNLTGTSSVTVGGNPATSVSVVNATTVTAVTPAGTAGAANVSLTTPYGSTTANGAFTYQLYGTPTISAVNPNSGPLAGGTAITITGTNLTGASLVTIGGVAATSVSVVSATTVTAVTPAGTAGAKTVSVTTPGGTANLTNGFSYTSVWYTVLEQNPDPAIVTSATLRNAITATGYPWRVRDNGTNIEMVLIPPGTFNMGCSASNSYGCGSDESPVHSVTLTSAFYMGRYEVTQAQWIARMGSNPSYFVARPENGNTANTNRPVEQVSWNQIAGTGGFLSGTGLRLPTEAEWEYAYRAGTTTAFHGFTGYLNGTNDDTLVGNIAWFSGNNGPSGTTTYGTKAVGQKLANGFGLHDMSGNAWEWVNDWYSSSYYASSPSTNPPGPASGSYRVLRGGGWYIFSYYVRSSSRFGDSPVITTNYIGFRVARAP